ncbi:MAG: gas vesicle protein [Kofleriaceae bacterium]|nr:gas vesicle protein [Kofleriaceae bacterium]
MVSTHDDRHPSTVTRGRSDHLSARNQTTNLADLLERVLDKGIVIAGDISISVGEVELITIKIRLLIASIDKAQEIGIDWWRTDPALSSQARRNELVEENRQLKARLDRLEGHLAALAARSSGDEH